MTKTIFNTIANNIFIAINSILKGFNCLGEDAVHVTCRRLS